MAYTPINKRKSALEKKNVQIISIPGPAPSKETLLALIEPLIPEVKDGHTPTEEELVSLIRPLIPNVKDGKTPTKEELLSLIRPLIPKVENGKTPTDEYLLSLITPLIPTLNEIPADEIVEKINTSKKKIKRSLIEGLEEKLAELGKPTINGVSQWTKRRISLFKALSDTPDTYFGQAGKVVSVKADETGLEFTTTGGGSGDMTKAVYDTDDDGVVDFAETLPLICRNSTGVTIPKMSVVYITGATGQTPTIALAKADAEATSSKTLGVVVSDIANNATGRVVTNGYVHNLNTSAFVDGDLVYLSAATAGGLTATRPTQPNHGVFIGYVAYAHATQGKLVVNIQNGYELNELHNVLITSVADKNALEYDSATTLWKNVGEKEAVANKSTTLSADQASDTKYPSVKSVYDWATGLFALLAGSVSQAFSVSQLEVGHASDTTITRASAGVIAVEGVNVPTVSSTDTLTNKTIGAGGLQLAENASIALDPAGSADGKYSGITISGTAGATLAFGDVIVLDVTASKWLLADANSAAAADGDARGLIGMCVLASTDTNPTTILLNGTCRADANFPTLTITAPVYLSETAGKIVVAQPTTTDVVIRTLGFALTADEIYFNPSADYMTHT